MKVQEIMTSDVLTIGPEAEIRDVARIFVETRHLGPARLRCPARGSRGGLGGRHPVQGAGSGSSTRRRFGLVAGRRQRTARSSRRHVAIKVQEAMTRPAITISPYSSVAEAARLMSEHGINRLPVVKDGELVGIVTRTDLVRAFVRSDEDIRREIMEDAAPQDALARGPGGHPGRRRAWCRSAERPPRDEQRRISARTTRRPACRASSRSRPT